MASETWVERFEHCPDCGGEVRSMASPAIVDQALSEAMSKHANYCKGALERRGVQALERIADILDQAYWKWALDKRQQSDG